MLDAAVNDSTPTIQRQLRRSDLEDIMGHEQGPMISLIVPQQRRPDELKANQLEVRAAVDQAVDLLEADDELDDELVETLAERLRDLQRDEALYLSPASALLIFLAPGFERLYKLPADLERTVVVGPSFHTREVLGYLSQPERFYLLGLSKKRAQVWVGTRDHLIANDIPDLPPTFETFYGEDGYNKEYTLNYHSQSSADAPKGQAVYHGQGEGKDDELGRLRTYFRAVDRALSDHVHGDDAPVILAGVERHHTLYRELSDLDHLAERGIQGNPFKMDRGDLHERGLEITREDLRARGDRMRELWETSFKLEKTEQDLSNIAHLAVQGRIRALMIERGRQIWGEVGREFGQVQIHDHASEDPDTDAVEVLDELSELVWQHGGEVLALDPDQMPTDTGGAAVLR